MNRAHERLTPAPLAAAALLALAFELLLLVQASAGSARVAAARASHGEQCASVIKSSTVSASFGRFSLQTKDANGCPAYTYQLFGPVSGRFFAGPNFRAGVSAYEWGTLERTELVRGQQLIVVSNPTKAWQSEYRGFDTCSAVSTGVICTAAAVAQLPTSWFWLILGSVVLGLLLACVVHVSRPAGPIRRPRHFRRRQSALAAAADNHQMPTFTPRELKHLQRRLRRLEGFLEPELSESQRRWFTHHLTTGRHGGALESLARWFAESSIPIPGQLREEFEWLASSLDIRHLVLPILDAHASSAEVDLDPKGRQAEPSTGFDVPPQEFQKMVTEALESLPDEFARAMDNVAITVEEVATQEIAKGRTILGVYIGVPLTKRRHWQWNVQPDKIIVYRKTICDHSASESEVRAQVYRTVIHEIAHHFGIGDPLLRELGW